MNVRAGRVFLNPAVGLLIVLLLARGGVAAAQTTSDGGPDPSMVRVRLGPVWLNPSISLSNIGVDNNVFNEPDSAPPKSDFTLTLSPQTTMWLRLGRTWLTGNAREDIVWYKDYKSERAANTTYGLGWRAPLNRMTFGTTATWLYAHDRPGYDIDARADRTDSRYGASVELQALSKTFIGVNATWANIGFGTDEVFQGSNLHDELTRRSFLSGLALRHQLTPLTSVTLGVSRAEDRFELTPLRNANSMTYSAGLSFNALALINGSATVGYRSFEPLPTEVPAYTGLTTTIDLSYSLLGSTRFSGQVNRDIQYSYDVSQPYYLATGASLSVTQRILTSFDVVGRVGWQQLAYRDRAGAAVAVPDREDNVRTYGGGIGYHVGSLRIGFDVDRQTRTSDLAARQYAGLRYGSSITFGM